jgi:hypothetical protein
VSRVTFKWTPEAFMAAASKAVDKGLLDAASTAARIAGQQLGTRHGGKPSKPGMPPNSQTGTLRRSHGWELNRPKVARYGVGVKYGPWLEKGTSPRKNGHPGMAARPWLTIPITRHRQRLNDRFTRSALAAMKGSAR